MSEIPISISARHIHLCEADLRTLFGPEASLTVRSPLSQPGQFAAEQTVDLIGPRKRIDRVRVLGPLRKRTQVEISRTDELALGIDAPIRASGDLDNTPGLVLEGPAGRLELESGVIQALRHIHMSPADAERLGVRDKDWVMVRVGGERGIIFDDVLVRVNPEYILDMHIDTDEANAANLLNGGSGQLIAKPTVVQVEPND